MFLACTLRGSVVDAGGLPLRGKLVRVRLSPRTDGSLSPTVLSPIDVWTDRTGEWAVNLLQGAGFRIEIPALFLDAVGTIPSENHARLETVALTPTPK